MIAKGHKSHGIETNGSRFATVKFWCSSWSEVKKKLKTEEEIEIENRGN
jgi:hypothetical protein